MIESELIDLRQTAKTLHITYGKAPELARQGVLPVVRLGRQVRVCPKRLAAFIASGGRALPGGWRRQA